LITQTQQVTVTAPPVTVTASGGSGGGGTVYVTVGGGGSSSSSFICRSTPVSYLKRKKRGILESMLPQETIQALAIMRG